MENQNNKKKSFEYLWHDIMGKYERIDLEEKNKKENERVDLLIKHGW